MVVSTTTPERLNCEDESWWICLCGNEPHKEGFYTCDANGFITSPTADGRWDGKSFICYNCGRVFDGDSGVVSKKANRLALRHNQHFDFETY